MLVPNPKLLEPDPADDICDCRLKNLSMLANVRTKSRSASPHHLAKLLYIGFRFKTGQEHDEIYVRLGLAFGAELSVPIVTYECGDAVVHKMMREMTLN